MSSVMFVGFNADSFFTIQSALCSSADLEFDQFKIMITL